jgi:hypothetical protein
LRLAGDLHRVPPPGTRNACLPRRRAAAEGWVDSCKQPDRAYVWFRLPAGDHRRINGARGSTLFVIIPVIGDPQSRCWTRVAVRPPSGAKAGLQQR